MAWLCLAAGITQVPCPPEPLRVVGQLGLNLRNLRKCASRTLRDIRGAMCLMPPGMLLLLQRLREIGMHHCDAAQQSAGRGLALARDFFVLRFLVAALLAPEEWRVVSGLPCNIRRE